MNKDFKKSSFGYFGLVIVWAIPLLFLIISTPNYSNEFLEWQNIVGAICVLFLVIFPSIVTTLSVLNQYSTKFTDFGVTRNFLGTYTVIYWNEIEDMESTIFTLTLKTQAKPYYINLVLYKDPGEIVDIVRLHIDHARTKKILA